MSTKLGAAAWREMLRKTFGTKAYGPLRKQLINAGVLNPQKEAEKLMRAAQGIAKKHGWRVEDPARKFFGSHGKYIQSLERQLKEKPALPSPLSKVLGTAAAVPKEETRKVLAKAKSFLEKERKFYANPSGLAGFDPIEGRLQASTKGSRGMVSAVHEAFEGLAHTRPIVPGRAWSHPAMRYFSHRDPSVILRESQVLPFLPRGTQQQLKAIRQGKETMALAKAGITYGRTPRIHKRDINALEKLALQQTMAGLEKYAATVRPEWVNQVESLINAGKHTDAHRLAQQHAPTAGKMWKIKPLGVGLDATTYLTVGNIPRAKEQPGIFVTKFVGTEKYPKWNMKGMMQDRAAVDKVLGSLGAKNYGRYIGDKGGVEFQEFVPGKATPDQMKKVRRGAWLKPRTWLWPGRFFGDLHEGNIRVNAAGVPKIIDARFQTLGRPEPKVDPMRAAGGKTWARVRSAARRNRPSEAVGYLMKKYHAKDAKEGLNVLRGLRKGLGASVRAPGFFADALRSPTYWGLGAAGLAVGGSHLYKKLQESKRKKHLQNRAPARV